MTNVLQPMQMKPALNVPLGEILNYYVCTVSIRKRSYTSEVHRIGALSKYLGHIQLGQVTPMDVSTFRDIRLSTKNPRNPSKTLATSTVKLELMLLSHVFTTAASDWGMDQLANPVARVRKPKVPPGRTRRLTAAEERKLLYAAARHSNPQFYAIVVLALETAMRQGEILSLRWENVHWNQRTVHLAMTKNGEQRNVPLSRKAYDILHDYLPRKSSGVVFDSYTSNGIKSAWRAFTKGAGIADFHFHDMRHCAISSLLERGLNTLEVAAISGHKSMSMLKRYAHLSSCHLVEKLDPKPRAKKFRPVLREQLPAYPAIVTRYCRRIDIDFPDFIDLRFSGTTEQQVMETARAKLLRTVVEALCNGTTPPAPSPADSISVESCKSSLVMISPL